MIALCCMNCRNFLSFGSVVIIRCYAKKRKRNTHMHARTHGERDWTVPYITRHRRKKVFFGGFPQISSPFKGGTLKWPIWRPISACSNRPHTKKNCNEKWENTIQFGQSVAAFVMWSVSAFMHIKIDWINFSMNSHRNFPNARNFIRICVIWFQLKNMVSWCQCSKFECFRTNLKNAFEHETFASFPLTACQKPIKLIYSYLWGEKQVLIKCAIVAFYQCSQWQMSNDWLMWLLTGKIEHKESERRNASM